MPDILHVGNVATFDEASGKLRGILEDLPGVGQRTLTQKDFFSAPRNDCQPHQRQKEHEVFNRLVLLALAENAAWQSQQKPRAKAAAKG